MRLIDTHTHLYDEQLLPQIDMLIKKAVDAGVEKMYMPNCDSSTIDGMLHLADQYPDHCIAMMGVHPCYVKDNFEEELAIAYNWLQKRPFAAIGEIGIDKYWDLTFLKEQRIAFERQIDWALEYDLPIVIHSRESTQDCIDIVRNKQNGKLKGIFHCFSGTQEEAQQIVDLGLYLGIGGVVTFKKSNLAAIISDIGLEHIVLETDTPYLAPVPHRGKRNESSYIPLIADHIATVLQIPLVKVAEQTTRNAEKIFSL